MKKLLVILSALAIQSGAASAADLVGNDQSLQNVRNLTSEINWYTGLPQAEWQAQRDGKLVFWVHMLGSLSGAT